MPESYATFGWGRSIRQVRHAFQQKKVAHENMTTILTYLQQNEAQMVGCYGRPLQGLKILEIGPGQDMQRAHYFGLKNDVDAFDLDVIPQGMNPSSYYQMYRANGLGRVVKTIGRKAIIGNTNQQEWLKVIGGDQLRHPTFIHGDICQEIPKKNHYDVVMSWSVFEHVPDPRAAFENVIASLKPGGIFYVSLHLWTSNNGHHDIRAFTGGETELPLWAHLRPSQRNMITPSSWLNEWRLPQWRALIDEIAPGAEEYLEQYEHPESYGSQLDEALRQELNDYSDEELLTVNVVYLWKKPV